MLLLYLEIEDLNILTFAYVFLLSMMLVTLSLNIKSATETSIQHFFKKILSI